MFNLNIGLRYCYRLYNQIINIYKIKKYLDIIFNSYNETEIIQKEKYETLKQLIFSNGSIYIKFFQSDEYYHNSETIDKSDLIKKSDIIVIGVEHKKYKRLSIPKNKIVVNMWE